MANQYTTQSIHAYFGKRVKELRTAAGITQEIMAEYVGIARPGLTMIETGKNGCTNLIMYKICCALNCSVADLFPPIIPAKRKTKTVTKRTTIFVDTQKLKKLI